MIAAESLVERTFRKLTSTSLHHKIEYVRLGRVLFRAAKIWELTERNTVAGSESRVCRLRPG